MMDVISKEGFDDLEEEEEDCEGLMAVMMGRTAGKSCEGSFRPGLGGFIFRTLF
jgi:hypothetical protein